MEYQLNENNINKWLNTYITMFPNDLLFVDIEDIKQEIYLKMIINSKKNAPATRHMNLFLNYVHEEIQALNGSADNIKLESYEELEEIQDYKMDEMFDTILDLHYFYNIIIKIMYNKLTLEERTILIQKYGFKNNNCKTYEDIGKELKFTRERIRQIENEALEKLRKTIDKYKLILNTNISQMKLWLNYIYNKICKTNNSTDNIKLEYIDLIFFYEHVIDLMCNNFIANKRKEVIKKYDLLNGEYTTLEEIGEYLYLDTDKIDQIVNEALEKLKKNKLQYNDLKT